MQVEAGLHYGRKLNSCEVEEEMHARARASRRSTDAPADRRASDAPADERCAWCEWRPDGWLQLRHECRCVDPASFGVVVVDGVLSREECATLAHRAETAGFEDSQHRGKVDEGFRRGGRCALSDATLADRIFAAIEPALPAKVRPASLAMSKLSAVYLSREPPWGPAAGVWSELRVLSYGAGDFFAPHRDNRAAVGASSELPATSSFLSLLLYLSDSHDGSGATRLRLSPAGDFDGDDEEMGGADVTLADVVPCAGRALVFPHRLLHESLPLRAGRKLVVRGDVLFEPPAEGAAGEGEGESEDEFYD